MADNETGEVVVQKGIFDFIGLSMNLRNRILIFF